MALQQKLDATAKGATYSYDPRGPLAVREWARLRPGSATEKVTTTYTHNRAGELNGMTYNDGTLPVSLTRDGSGRIASIADGTGSRNFAYDDAGRLVEENAGRRG